MSKALLLGGAAAFVFVVPAMAQDVTSVPDAPAIPDKVANPEAGEQAVQSAVGAGDIIVTARKRQESILKVPVIETVLTQTQINDRQLQTISDVATLTPGLILGESSLEVGTQVSIRGIGTTSLDPGIDQSVSLNLDGLQVTQGSAYSVGLFDMAQVEILKGPQALFFGKNSPAGVVAIRSADPGDKFELVTRGSYEFEANDKQGEVIVSGPVTDTLGLRLAAHYGDFGGYFRNIAVADTTRGGSQPPRDFGHEKTLLLRGTALFKPAPDFSARLKLNYTKDNEDGGAPYQLTSCPDGLGSYAGVAFFSPKETCRIDRDLAFAYSDPASFGNNLRHGGKNFTRIEQKFGTLELNYNPQPQLTLTSITGYYKLHTDAAQNGTVSGTQASIVADKSFGRREFTQELRVTSDYSSPLNFTAGGFYQDGRMTNFISLFGNTNLFAPGVGLPPILQQGSHDVHIRSASAFAQVRYKIVPKLELSAGARYTDEKRRDDATRSFFGGPFADVTPPRIHSKNWSPEFTATYTPTDDLTIFGSLKQAYKSGSYNLIVPVPADPPGYAGTPNDNSFGDERIRGGELGIKARLADRQIFINLAGYYYTYKGLQVGVNEAEVGGLTIIRTVNAGNARIYGADFDFSYRPATIPGLNIHGAVNYNHARFTSFNGAPCWGGETIAEGCNTVPITPTAAQIAGGYYSLGANGQPVIYSGQNLKGQPLTRAPSWQATLGTSYEMPVGQNKRLNFGIDGQYSSRYSTNLGLSRPDFYQRAYGKINANIGLHGPDDAWEFALIGNNLTDKLTTGNCTNLNYAGGQVLPGAISGAPIKGPSGSDELICTFDRGRQVILRLTLRPTALLK